MNPKVKGKITFRIAAILFLLSAVLEVFSLTSKVPLLGAGRGGVIAITYHLIYCSFFLALGIGLWKAKLWAHKLVFVAAFFYTLDKVQYVISRKSMEAGLRQQLSRYEEFGLVFDIGTILQLATLLTLLFIACWWGFALYTYLRRDYFQPRQESDATISSNQTNL